MQLAQELTPSKEPTPNRFKINTKDKPLKIKGSSENEVDVVYRCIRRAVRASRRPLSMSGAVQGPPTHKLSLLHTPKSRGFEPTSQSHHQQSSHLSHKERNIIVIVI